MTQQRKPYKVHLLKEDGSSSQCNSNGRIRLKTTRLYDVTCINCLRSYAESTHIEEDRLLARILIEYQEKGVPASLHILDHDKECNPTVITTMDKLIRFNKTYPGFTCHRCMKKASHLHTQSTTDVDEEKARALELKNPLPLKPYCLYSDDQKKRLKYILSLRIRLEYLDSRGEWSRCALTTPEQMPATLIVLRIKKENLVPRGIDYFTDRVGKTFKYKEIYTTLTAVNRETRELCFAILGIIRLDDHESDTLKGMTYYINGKNESLFIEITEGE